MSEPSEGEVPAIQIEIADLVRRALLQAGAMQDVENKLKEITQRTSQITPPPQSPPEARE